jgi:hypothetical protein
VTLSQDFTYFPAFFSLVGPLMLGLLLGIAGAPVCAGYSVLTHEAIIDAEWKNGIEPLLLTRFPYATAEQLLQAHPYAYGGAIIQDMGYYSRVCLRMDGFRLVDQFMFSVMLR